ncbi:MAG: TIGR03067 domain-containing protein [Pirellulales bacterium]
MRFRIGVCLAVCMLMGAGAPQDGATPNSDAFHGVWQLSGGESAGKALSAAQLEGGTLVIEDGRYTVTLADVGTVTGTQKLGEADGLKTIDITDDSGPRAGQTCLGIYEFDGDEFRVIFASPGEHRPTKFETMPDSGQWMQVWKRAQY